MQFEPALVMREAAVMAQFTNMVNKRAKMPAKTKALLVEFDERAKRVEEITGERIENRHMMSVVIDRRGVLDSESMKYTAQFQGATVRADVLKRKVVEFANLMSTGTKSMDSMDIGRFEKSRGRMLQTIGTRKMGSIGLKWVHKVQVRYCRQWIQNVTNFVVWDIMQQSARAKGLVREKTAAAKAKEKLQRQ